MWRIAERWYGRGRRNGRDGRAVWDWGVRTRLGEELPQLVVLLGYLACSVVDTEVSGCGGRWSLNLWQLVAASEHFHNLARQSARQSRSLCRQDAYAGVDGRAVIEDGTVGRHVEGTPRGCYNFQLELLSIVNTFLNRRRASWERWQAGGPFLCHAMPLFAGDAACGFLGLPSS